MKKKRHSQQQTQLWNRDEAMPMVESPQLKCLLIAWVASVSGKILLKMLQGSRSELSLGMARAVWQSRRVSQLGCLHMQLWFIKKYRHRTHNSEHGGLAEFECTDRSMFILVVCETGFGWDS